MLTLFDRAASNRETSLARISHVGRRDPGLEVSMAVSAFAAMRRRIFSGSHCQRAARVDVVKDAGDSDILHPRILFGRSRQKCGLNSVEIAKPCTISLNRGNVSSLGLGAEPSQRDAKFSRCQVQRYKFFGRIHAPKYCDGAKTLREDNG